MLSSHKLQIEVFTPVDYIQNQCKFLFLLNTKDNILKNIENIDFLRVLFQHWV